MNALRIGVVGCGHLGQAIARSLVDRGLESRNLLISYRGSPLTYQKLEEQGLACCLAANQRIFGEAGIVLLTTKPQDLLELKEVAVSGKPLVVSCMAGVSTGLLCAILGSEPYRMMFSGPDTIASGTGVAAMYPEHESLRLLLRCINLTQIKTPREEDLDIFTAGVCIPAAILSNGSSSDQQEAIKRIGAVYPLLSELYAWAVKILPHFENNADKEAYIQRMITKGGITEAIVKGLASGAPLDTALHKGIDRTREISDAIRQSIADRG